MQPHRILLVEEEEEVVVEVEVAVGRIMARRRVRPADIENHQHPVIGHDRQGTEKNRHGGDRPGIGLRGQRWGVYRGITTRSVQVFPSYVRQSIFLMAMKFERHNRVRCISITYQRSSPPGTIHGYRATSTRKT